MADDISKDTDQDVSEPSKTPKQSSKPAKKPASSGVKKVASKPKTQTSAMSELGLPQKVDFMWTIAFVVVAFVLGFFIRGLFLPSDSGSAISSTNNISNSYDSGVSGGGTGGAPALSEDQLNKQLPANHPSIPGVTPQPSTTATFPTSSGAMGNVKSDVPASGALQSGGQSVEVTSPAKK